MEERVTTLPNILKDSREEYNFDIKEMIDNFDYYDYLINLNNQDRNNAFLIITDKQYIIGYNQNYGEGIHNHAFARCMKDLKGGGTILQKEEKELTSECINNYLTGRLTYEDNRKYILFNLTTGDKTIKNKNISPKQYEVFKMFYDDYNERIKNSSIEVDFHYALNNRSIGHTSNNLDELLILLEGLIDNSLDNEKEEIIIGKPLNNDVKKLIKM